MWAVISVGPVRTIPENEDIAQRANCYCRDELDTPCRPTTVNGHSFFRFSALDFAPYIHEEAEMVKVMKSQDSMQSLIK